MSTLKSSADARHLLLSQGIYHAGIIDLQEEQGPSKMPLNQRGADQVLLVPHSSGYLEPPSGCISEGSDEIHK